MKISIIHTSRGRPKECLETAFAWIEAIHSVGELHLRYSLGVEETDQDEYKHTLREIEATYGVEPFIFKKGVKRRLELDEINQPDFQFPLPIQCYTANTKGAKLCQEAIDGREGVDWLFCIADNLMPPKNLARIKPFLSCHTGEDAKVLVYDSDFKRSLVAHPIINKAWFDKRGRVQPIELFHLFGDAFIFLESMFYGELIKLPAEIQKIHLHGHFGTAPKDAQFYFSNNPKMGAHDNATFERMRKFLIEEWVKHVYRI